jgi:two-component sensor histidine kinase
MTDSLFTFIHTIELLSKNEHFRSGNTKLFTEILLKEASVSMDCERVNVWLLENGDEELRNSCSYSMQGLEKQATLQRSDFPNYFKHLLIDEIIVSNNAIKEQKNEELIIPYVLPNRIVSMMDIPLRSEGKMIGVLCFESTKAHEWNLAEQKFGQSLAQLLSQSMETERRIRLQKELGVLLHQKDILIAEIHHRVKNNISVILSLINIQRQKVTDDYHDAILVELKDKIFSISAVQEQLHIKKNVDSIDLKEFLEQLSSNLIHSQGEGLDVKLNLDLEQVQISIEKAIPLGLIANELITNAFKHAFKNEADQAVLSIELFKRDKNLHLILEDNGIGFNPSQMDNGLGLELIQDLTEQIGGSFKIRRKENSGTLSELEISCDCCS